VFEHTPVLEDEIIKHLRLHRGATIVDATLGCGGHAARILEKITPGGLLIGIDHDDEAILNAKAKLKPFNAGSYKIIKANFRDIDVVLRRINIDKVDSVLFDLGVSSLQLESPTRGFGIKVNGPLDMRMDNASQLHAFWVINKYPRQRLEDIIRNYGEERYARKIARYITDERVKSTISTTSQLAGIIERAVGYRYKRLKIHPATRTFQAIRIEVNDELNALRDALGKLPKILNNGARVCVISFHSLEDRIVKILFREYSKKQIALLITKKPITASHMEILKNPRARSAKLRVAEFKGEEK